MEVARALGALRDVIVVTNALNVATELGMHRDISVTVTGGAVRPVSLELSGPIAERTLEDYNIDIAFVGADGVDVKAGVTKHNEAEARTNRALITRAHRVVVVVDRSKLGEVRFAKICDLATVDLLITDSGAPPEAFEALAPHVPEILLA